MVNNKVGIIDLDSIIFAIMHPNKVLDDNHQPIKKDGKFQYFDKTESEIIKCADELMNEIIFDSKSTHYIAYVKGKNTTSNRLSVNSSYKANRNKETPKFWEFTKQYLIKNWGAIEIHDMEVDDACRISRKQIPGSFIIAVDKDLLNLEGISYNWKTKIEKYTSQHNAKYLFFKDMLVGQPGDNIKGIDGVGEVKASKILDTTRKGDLYACKTLEQYIFNFGEYEAVRMFYMNYMSLYILDEFPGFEAPRPIKWNIPEYMLERFNNRVEAQVDIPE